MCSLLEQNSVSLNRADFLHFIEMKSATTPIGDQILNKNIVIGYSSTNFKQLDSLAIIPVKWGWQIHAKKLTSIAFIVIIIILGARRNTT